MKIVAALLSGRARFFAQVYRASSDLTHALICRIVLVRDADPRYIQFTEQLLLNADLETVSRLLAVLLAVDEDGTLATIEVPTTIVGGTEDAITPIDHARRMTRVNPDVELVELPGIGHMTPLEAHEVVNTLVAQLAEALRQPARDKAGGMLADDLGTQLRCQRNRPGSSSETTA
ncbi:MAG: alpha/beta hydrolase, partial [Actinomycetota bacterium]|nr:alpha/beta hydrolase [Actinomycetota bacterium]